MKQFLCLFALVAVALAEPEAEASVPYGGSIIGAPLVSSAVISAPLVSSYSVSSPLLLNSGLLGAPLLGGLGLNRGLIGAPLLGKGIWKREADAEPGWDLGLGLGGYGLVQPIPVRPAIALKGPSGEIIAPAQAPANIKVPGVPLVSSAIYGSPISGGYGRWKREADAEPGWELGLGGYGAPAVVASNNAAIIKGPEGAGTVVAPAGLNGLVAVGPSPILASGVIGAPGLIGSPLLGLNRGLIGSPLLSLNKGIWKREAEAEAEPSLISNYGIGAPLLSSRVIASPLLLNRGIIGLNRGLIRAPLLNRGLGHKGWPLW